LNETVIMLILTA